MRNLRFRWLAAGIVALGLLWFSPWGLAARAQDSALAPAFSLESWRLPNGLQVLFVDDRRAPLVTVQIFYHVGSRDEPEGKRGVAQLFESLLDGGSERIAPGRWRAVLANVGAVMNAYTTEDFTAFQVTLPARRFQLALGVEADRMRRMALSSLSVSAARARVLTQRKEQIESSGLGRALERAREALFPGHPYALTAVGRRADIEGITESDCRSFYDAHYQPGNATLVVTGDLRRGDVEQIILAEFGGFPRTKPQPRKILPKPAAVDSQPAPLVLPALAPLDLVAFRLPGAGHRDIPALRVLAEALGGKDVSVLRKRLLQVEQLGKNAGAGLEVMAGQGALMAFVSPGAPEGAAAARAALLAELDRIAKEGIDVATVDRARRRLAARQVQAMGTPDGLANLLGEAALLKGQPQSFARAAGDVWAVSAVDVKRVAARYLRADNRVQVRLETAKAPDPVPTPPAAESTAKPPSDPAQVLAPTPPRQPTTIVAPPLQREIPSERIQRGTLANGLELIFLQRPQLPQVSMRLVISAGPSNEPPDRPGVAALLASLLRAGTERRSRDELARAIDQVGGRLNTDADNNGITIGCSVLLPDAPLCLDLVSDLALRPLLAPGDLKEGRAELVSYLRRRYGQADELTVAHLENMVLGDAHPAGRTLTGPALDTLDEPDVRAFYAAYFRPNNARLIIVGPGDLNTWLRRAKGPFEGWSSGEAPARKATGPENAPRAAVQRLIVDRSDLEDAVMVTGVRLPGRASPDWAAALVVNQMFGGGLGRLTTWPGWPGGVPGSVVSSHVTAGAKVGLLRVQLASAPATVVAAEAAIHAQWRRVASMDSGDPQLERARLGVISAIGPRMVSGHALAEAMAEAELQGAGAEAAVRLPWELEAVDAASVGRTALAVLETGARTSVFLGPGRDLAAALTKAGLGFDRTGQHEPISAAQRKANLKALQAAAQAGEPARARDLLRRALNAQGGIEKMRALKDLKVTKVGRRMEGDQVADLFSATYHRRPGSVRIEQEVILSSGRSRQAVVVTPAEVRAGTLGGLMQPLRDRYAQRFRGAVFEDVMFILLNVVDSRPPLLSRLLPDKERDGRRFEGASVRLPGGDWTAFYFDATTHRLDHLESTDEIGYPRIETVSDYRPVAGGLLFPFRVVSSGTAAGELTIKEITLSPAIPPGSFD